MTGRDFPIGTRFYNDGYYCEIINHYSPKGDRYMKLYVSAVDMEGDYTIDQSVFYSWEVVYPKK